MTVYREAGVDIDAAARARQLMAEAVRSTYSAAVLAGIGAFGGCFDLHAAVGNQTDDVVLVASTDSVGTKTLVAAALGRYETLGYDLVNHCVNDILVQGARPLSCSTIWQLIASTRSVRQRWWRVLRRLAVRSDVSCLAAKPRRCRMCTVREHSNWQERSSVLSDGRRCSRATSRRVM
jgi:phosphoribosylformylglycinamidine cyclo-ligase (EC 6.3.3.1)